jgi:hypothetical protein
MVDMAVSQARVAWIMEQAMAVKMATKEAPMTVDMVTTEDLGMMVITVVDQASHQEQARDQSLPLALEMLDHPLSVRSTTSRPYLLTSSKQSFTIDACLQGVVKDKSVCMHFLALLSYTMATLLKPTC